MVETIRTREIELINEIRGGITDPNGRCETATDLFNGTGAVFTFTLTKLQVKNILSFHVIRWD